MLAKETLVSDSSGVGPRYGSTRSQTRFQPQDEAPSVRANIGGRLGGASVKVTLCRLEKAH